MLRGASRLLIAATLVVLALPACGQEGPVAFGTGRLTLHGATGDASLIVQVAGTDRARQAGLMGRPALGADRGMVFLFDGPTDARFWMKDTLIPLSIAFWGSDRRVVAVLDMPPCRSDPCPLYGPVEAYVGAVEANLGFFAAHGVGPGALVRLTRG